MERKVLDSLFQEYADAVMSQLSEDSVQYKEMRRSFFSGMIALFSYLNETFTTDEGRTDPTPEDFDKLEQIETEIGQWALNELVNMTFQFK